MTVDIKKIKGEIYDSKNSLGDSLNTLAKKKNNSSRGFFKYKRPFARLFLMNGLEPYFVMPVAHGRRRDILIWH